MNITTLIGRNVKPPETRYNGELAICRFTLAVDRQKTQKNQDPGADFISIVCFGKTAQIIEKYITTKGRKVAVQGRIQTGSYEGKDGKTVYFTEVIADRVEFLDRAGEEELTPSRQAENKSKNMKPAEDDFAQIEGFSKLSADDIPF